jgi:anti-sigma B factor antagonist
MDINISEYVVRTHIITLSGRVDAFSAPTLREAQERLLAEGATHFVIDLREVTFLDSSGMAALVALLKRARTSSGDVKLVSPTSTEARRILSLTRFDQVFQMCNTPEEALR